MTCTSWCYCCNITIVCVCVYLFLFHVFFVGLRTRVVAPITTGKCIVESKITRTAAGAIGTWSRILPSYRWVTIDTRIFGYTPPTIRRLHIQFSTNVMVFGPTMIPVRAADISVLLWCHRCHHSDQFHQK